MKTLYHYLAEGQQQEYKFRVKTTFEMNDLLMNQLEESLSKYRIIDISKPKKTNVKDHPFEFRDIDNSSVWVIEIILGKPASSYILQQELRSEFNVSEKFVVVRGENEPIEIETQRINAAKEMEKIARDQGLTPQPLLSTNPSYEDYEEIEHEPSYGDSYNKRLLDFLAEIEVEREEGIVETGLSQKKWAKWMKNPPKTEDFNKKYDTPKPVTKKKSSPTPVPNSEVSDQDNFDDSNSTFTKVYRKNDNELVIMSRKLNS